MNILPMDLWTEAELLEEFHRAGIVLPGEPVTLFDTVTNGSGFQAQMKDEYPEFRDCIATSGRQRFRVLFDSSETIYWKKGTPR